MTTFGSYTDIGVELDQHVAVVEIQRPPNNFFDVVLIRSIAEAFEDLDKETDCRAIVLASDGKHFCAGANLGFQNARTGGAEVRNAATQPGDLYREGVRLFRTGKPIVGAIQGAAVGGGLGLALVPDFRVACEEARFSANFSRLGFYPGFGLTTTLPELVGKRQASMMFLTGKRVKGDEAYRIGLADLLVPLADVRGAAIEVARELAISAPLSVIEIRSKMRAGLADRVEAATDEEAVIQGRLRATADYREGVKAMDERRDPRFKGE